MPAARLMFLAPCAAPKLIHGLIAALRAGTVGPALIFAPLRSVAAGEPTSLVPLFWGNHKKKQEQK